MTSLPPYVTRIGTCTSPTSKPQSRTNARLSSTPPALAAQDLGEDGQVLVGQPAVGQHRPIALVELPLLAEEEACIGLHAPLHLGDLPGELGDEPLLAFHRPAELPDVLRIHAGVEVQTVGMVRRYARVAPRSYDPMRPARRGQARVVRRPRIP